MSILKLAESTGAFVREKIREIGYEKFMVSAFLVALFIGAMNVLGFVTFWSGIGAFLVLMIYPHVLVFITNKVDDLSCSGDGFVMFFSIICTILLGIILSAWLGFVGIGMAAFTVATCAIVLCMMVACY